MKLGSSQATTSPGRRIARAASVRAWLAPVVIDDVARVLGRPARRRQRGDLLAQLGHALDVGVLERPLGLVAQHRVD